MLRSTLCYGCMNCFGLDSYKRYRCGNVSITITWEWLLSRRVCSTSLVTIRLCSDVHSSHCYPFQSLLILYGLRASCLRPRLRNNKAPGLTIEFAIGFLQNPKIYIYVFSNDNGNHAMIKITFKFCLSLYF